jgi:predicted nucleic-acid-binding protein
VKGIDTNILVRYLTQDDAKQARLAEQAMQRATVAGEPLYINQIVLCETAWVLDRAYGHARQDIAATLEQLLRVQQFEIEGKAAAWLALADYQAGKADFADCLIGVNNRQAGCDATLTLDRAASSLATFELLKP